MSSADVCRWPKLYLFNQLCTNRAGLAHLPASKLPSELYLKKAESDLVYPPRNTTSHTSTYLQLLQLLVLQNLLTVNVSKMTDTLMWSSWRTVQYLSLQHSDCKPLTGNFLRQNRIAPYNPILTCEATGLVSASFLVWEIWLWNVWHFLVTDGCFTTPFFVCIRKDVQEECSKYGSMLSGALRGAVPTGTGQRVLSQELSQGGSVWWDGDLCKAATLRRSKVQAFRGCSVAVCRWMSELFNLQQKSREFV